MPGFALAFNQRASLGAGRELAVRSLTVRSRRARSLAVRSLAVHSHRARSLTVRSRRAPFNVSSVSFAFYPCCNHRRLQAAGQHCPSLLQSASVFPLMKGAAIKRPAPPFRGNGRSSPHQGSYRILQIRGQRFSTCVGCSELMGKEKEEKKEVAAESREHRTAHNAFSFSNSPNWLWPSSNHNGGHMRHLLSRKERKSRTAGSV